MGPRALPVRLIKGQKPFVERKLSGGNPGTVWEVPNSEVETNEHPTSKPNRLFAIPMQLHTQPNDLCYEPFSGSGSQLIAAEQLAHRCYAIELEPRFVDVAITRWEKLTGKKAELIEEGDANEFQTASHANPPEIDSTEGMKREDARPAADADGAQTAWGRSGQAPSERGRARNQG